MTRSGVDLAGRGIAVTGAGGHLGRALCLGLAASGATVVACGRRPGPLQELAEQAARGGFPGRVLPERADVSLEADVERVLDRLQKDAGGVHGWVNNAFSAPAEPLGQLTRRATLAALESGLADAMLCTQATVSRMRRRQGARDAGSIVNIASIYGIVSPQPEVYAGCEAQHSPAAYGAAKAGLIQFTRYAACHLAGRGVRVNSVSPGPFPRPEVTADAGFVSELERRVPLGRLGEPEELVGPVAFLLSDASSFVTGHNLVVDGGWTAR